VWRVAGDALCKPRGKFWGLHPVDAGRPPTCKRCVAIAGRWAE
jgi:hypothetical protein